MTHLVAHIVIFFGYIAAMVLVPQAFAAVFRISRVTATAGAGFFITCGATHLGLSLKETEALWVAIGDHLQAGFIVAFVLALMHDLNRVRRRLMAAYISFGVKYGKAMADEIRATLEHALRG